MNREMPLREYMFGFSMDQVHIQEVPLFTSENLELATNFFSINTKIGRGGFGSVYKGKLEDGKEIAVKRLSKLLKDLDKAYKNS